MRICPQCMRNFGEQEFRVCPFDGATLTEQSEQTTLIADPMIGRVLDGRFRIIEAIGRGGMGAVYKAVHTQMDRVCAVKLLAPDPSDRVSAVARFRREAKLTSRIDSPNAVTIYDFGEAEPGLLYIAMEYIEGESLAELLAREPTLTTGRVVKLTSQVADALAAAHALGIVHRDLKPANIMLVRKGGDAEIVKVLDFGIAKSVTDGFDDHLTQTGFLLGTPTYMSPEQVLGENVDSRTDVYSLALIVYQMLCGRMPFEGDNLRALMMKRVNGEPRPLRAAAPAVPAVIERVVMSGLAREPALRVPDVQTFAARLRAAAADRETSPGGIPTVVEGQSFGAVAPPPPLDATRMTPTGMTAGDESHPSSSVTLPAPPRERPKVEDSATILAPQVPYTPETINAAWQAHAPAAPVAPAPVVKAKSSKLVPILAVAAVLFVLVLVGLGGGGYYVYRRMTGGATTTTAPNQPALQTSQTEARPETKTGAAPAAEQTADVHYRAGKSSQEQAASLADAGSAVAATSKNEEAVAEYRKALESRPNFPEARENLGVALYDLGRAGEAVAEYETAIKQYQKPTAQVWTNYGMALFEGKRYKDAAEAFAQSLIIQPNDADLHYYRAFALHYAGDEDGARAAFRKYLAAAPTGRHATAAKNILEGRAAPTLNLTGR